MEKHELIRLVARETGCYNPRVLKEILAEEYYLRVSETEINACFDLDIEDYYLTMYKQGLFLD